MLKLEHRAPQQFVSQPQVHVAISRLRGLAIFCSVLPPFWHKLIRVSIDALDLCFAWWQRLLHARQDWVWVGRLLACLGGWLPGWLAGWLVGWLGASFSQLCTNKLARRNLLHQRCQMPLQSPHLLYKLIEGVRFQSILLWYNHFSCLLPILSPTHPICALNVLAFGSPSHSFSYFSWLLQIVPARILHRGTALRLQHSGEAGASGTGTQRRIVESR